MKGLGNLVKNELIKTGKAVYFKVFVILILVASIVLPTGFFINDKIDEKRKDDISWEEDYYYNAADTPVEKAYYGCYAEASDFFSKNSISKDDWRYEEYYNVYAVYYCARAKAFDILAKGEIPYSEVETYFYDAIYPYEYSGSDYNSPNLSDLSAVTDKIDIPESDGDGNSFTYDGLSKEEYEKLRDQAEKNKENVANYIKSASIVTKYENLVKVAQDDAKTAKENLDEAQNRYNKTKSLDDSMALADAKAAYESKSVLLWGYQQLLDGKYDANDWHYSEVKNTLTLVSEALNRNVVYDKEVYKKIYSDNYKSYKRYLLSVEPIVKAANNAVTAIKYSFEKNIPVSGNDSKSASAYLSTQMLFVNIAICLFMIIMAGTTLSNEFISGSIRLLLIRPRSRSKILLSKILSVFIYGAGLMFISFIVLSALNMGLCETKDLFTKTVMLHASGRAYTAIPIVTALFKCVLSLFSVNVMISFSVFISVLFAKGGILAVALSTIIQIVCVCTSNILSAVNAALNGLLAYTPVPYLDMSFYLTNPIDAGTLYSGYYISIQSAFNPIVGAVVVTICSALFYTLAFVVFKKKQIKN